ncbi:hypothetical protein, partial [Yersinia pestis]
CFNKSKGVFITDPKLKALLNPQPSWGFSGHNNSRSALAELLPAKIFLSPPSLYYHNSLLYSAESPKV